MTGRRIRVAVVSVSAGAGHVRAAQAVVAAAGLHFPDVEAVHVDVMDHVSKAFRKTYADGYLELVERSPAFWGYLYARTDRAATDSTLNRLRGAIERLNTRAFARRLQELDPDVVLCTHFLPAQLLSRNIARGAWTRPVYVQVTDFDVHGTWIHERMAGYFAADPEVAFRMAGRGVPPDAIHVTGIPVMPVFGEPLDRATCAAELGTDPSRLTLALLAGGAGVTAIDGLAVRLLALPGDHQVVALAGRNEPLLARLRALAAEHPGRLVPLGFTTTIERVMAASDLAITKSGGLTTSECLAMGLPMIVVSPIPGQEERNADFLLEHGAALKAVDAAGLAFRVAELMAHPDRLAAMRRNARAAGRPDAARRVLEIALGRA